MRVEVRSIPVTVKKEADQVKMKVLEKAFGGLSFKPYSCPYIALVIRF